jgi:tetratricopeptide (TPR) repeat protein
MSPIRSPALTRKHINSKSPAASGAEDLCRRGILQVDRQEYAEALKSFDLALKKSSGNYLASVNRGLCLAALGRIEEAAVQFYILHKDHPRDARILKLCGVTHCELGDYETGLKFLTRFTKLVAEDYEAWTFMCMAAVKTGKNVEGTIYATKAIAIEPLKADAYNNLGTALLSLARFDDAAQAFHTALAIDPDNIMAMSNLATTAQSVCKYDEAIAIYENVLPKFEGGTLEEAECKYRASFAYLGAGRLSEGWDLYEYGFISTGLTSRNPKRKFNVPQWNGEPEQSKQLLVWAEQGLGDEIQFYSLLEEALLSCPNIIVECEPRLRSLLQRAYPQITVRVWNSNQRVIIEDYDMHIPAGSLRRLFRSDINDYKKFKPYIKPDYKLTEKFSARLTKSKRKLFVGLSWRSIKVDASRRQYYLMLEQFSGILSDSNYTIVNLQYGECEDELKRAEEALGIKILRWNDVDLKDDQEAVAALIDLVDVVISPQSAVAQMAMALGKELIIFGPKKVWEFLGQDKFPWGVNVDFMIPTENEDLRTTVPKIEKKLKDMAQRKIDLLDDKNI